MKFIPDAISRKIAQQGLAASENAPKLLFVGGVIGMLGSTALACRATLQLSDVLDRIEEEKGRHEHAKAYIESPEYTGNNTYPDKEFRKDIAIISARGVGSIAKLYAPALILGGVSIFALTKSHNILRDRNLALTAAYAAVDGAYMRYRERVRERYGDEVDRELLYETEQVDILDEETGELVTQTQIVGAPGSRYARWFDSESSKNWSTHPDINMLFLRSVQNYANDRLHAKGHVFLNEVLDELGMKHTSDGAIVGWRWKKGSGDDFIDLGIWDRDRENANELFNGRDGAVLLDFNVDGPIWDKIDEDDR